MTFPNKIALTYVIDDGPELRECSEVVLDLAERTEPTHALEISECNHHLVEVLVCTHQDISCAIVEPVVNQGGSVKTPFEFG